MGNGNGDTFGYAEFGNWYDAYRANTLEPALDRAMDALQRELDLAPHPGEAAVHGATRLPEEIWDR